MLRPLWSLWERLPFYFFFCTTRKPRNCLWPFHASKVGLSEFAQASVRAKRLPGCFTKCSGWHYPWAHYGCSAGVRAWNLWKDGKWSVEVYVWALRAGWSQQVLSKLTWLAPPPPDFLWSQKNIRDWQWSILWALGPQQLPNDTDPCYWSFHIHWVHNLHPGSVLELCLEVGMEVSLNLPAQCYDAFMKAPEETACTCMKALTWS